MRKFFAFATLSVALFLGASEVVSAQGGGGGGGAGGGGGGRTTTTISPGESCPAGMTEVRPRSCQAPEFPPPSIVDYRPHSTLVAPTHMVKTAKFPAIDYHGHVQGLLTSQQGLDSL